MKILITGGAGYLGSIFTEHLLSQGGITKLVVYDNSGNCYNLEINVGLIKKIFKYSEHETINLNHINKEKEII